MIIKDFAIFKNDKSIGSQPSHYMIGKDINAKKEDKSNTLASIWLNKSAKGLEYFSGVMKDEFTSKEGTYYDGFVILSKREYDRLVELSTASLKKGKTEEEITPIDLDKIKDDEIDLDKISF